MHLPKLIQAHTGLLGCRVRRLATPRACFTRAPAHFGHLGAQVPADRRRGMAPAMGTAAVAPILNMHHQHPRLPVRAGNTAACAVAKQRRAPAPIQRRPWVLRELANGSKPQRPSVGHNKGAFLTEKWLCWGHGR